jgi:hypothetical protein
MPGQYVGHFAAAITWALRSAKLNNKLIYGSVGYLLF